MTRYTVEWTPLAQGQLAQLWVDARDRDSVTAAAAQIDDELAENPGQKGRPRFGGLRELAVSPLCVFFSVNEHKHVVEVKAVKRAAEPTNGRP